MTRRRRHKTPPAEDLNLINKRRFGNTPEWWENYSDDELRMMQYRGRQLVEGGYDNVSWSDLLGEP